MIEMINIIQNLIIREVRQKMKSVGMGQPDMRCPKGQSIFMIDNDLDFVQQLDAQFHAFLIVSKNSGYSIDTGSIKLIQCLDDNTIFKYSVILDTYPELTQLKLQSLKDQ